MFPFMPVAVGSKLLISAFDMYLSMRQRRNFKPTVKPSAQISKLIPSGKYYKAQAYCHAKSTFELIAGSIDLLLETLLTIWYFNPYLWAKAGAYASSSELRQTLIFVSYLSAVSFVFELPTSIYSTFVLEARFGFNKTTVRTFIADRIKSLFLSAVLGYPLISLLYVVLKYVSQFDPIVVATALWSFGSFLMILMMWLFPAVIAPMFNTFTPMKSDSPVKARVEELASSLNFPLSEIYVIDGSRRSSHSNAFIFGLFKKYICIYDTLLSQCADAMKQKAEVTEAEEDKEKDEREGESNDDETNGTGEEEKLVANGVTGSKVDYKAGDDVVAVVCHELGHWKNGHLGKGVVKALIHTAVICGLYAVTAGNPQLFESFGFPSGVQPVVIGLMLFNAMLNPVDDLMTPWHNYMSRKFEYEADEFAKSKGMAQPLGEALVKMSIENLSNMNPDPLYSMWNYSHPTLLERLGALEVSADMPFAKEDKSSGADDDVSTVSSKKDD